MATKSYRLATGSLLIAGAILLITSQFRHTWWGAALFAGGEAALIGGLADWFAVTALFRHPLRQKWIPHTAIIPRNRHRIVTSVVDLVENQWLAMKTVKEKINSLSLLDKALQQLERPEARRRLRLGMKLFIIDLIQQINPAELAAMLEKVLEPRIKKFNLAPFLANALDWTIKNGYDDRIINYLLSEADYFIQKPEIGELIKEMVSKAVDDYTKGDFWRLLGKNVGVYLNLINYDEVAIAAQQKIVLILNDIRDNPEDPYRQKLKVALLDLLANLEQNPRYNEILENWKDTALSRLDFYLPLHNFIAAGQESLVRNIKANQSSLMFMLYEVLDEGITSLSRDEERRERLEKWLKKRVVRFVEENHSAIGRLVRENLEKLDDQVFTLNIEKKVGYDLQWIRVNGAIVGGMVGLILHFILG